MALETAEELVRELSRLARVVAPFGWKDQGVESIVAIVEFRDAARDNAARAALLEELRELVHRRSLTRGGDIELVLRHALADLAAKYTAKEGG